MLYEQIEPLGQSGISLEDIERRRKELLSPYAQPFKWRSEYLPIVIAVGGISVVAIIYGIRKRRKKKK